MTDLDSFSEPDEIEFEVHTLATAAELVGMSEQAVLVYVREGLVRTSSSDDKEPRFDDDAIQILRRVAYLREVEQVNSTGIRMILSLHQEVESLREIVRFYQHRA